MSDAPGVCLAAPRELARLEPLWNALIAHHLTFDPSYRTRDGAAGVWRGHMAERMEAGEAAVLVCGEGAGPTGFCSVEIQRAPDLIHEPARAEIAELFVAPAARRDGCGRSLVEAALAWVRDRGIVRVEVRVASANADGQSFWRALGWGDFVDVLERRL